ncbi:MAG: hypothetical protein ACF8GE_01070 [Phycisphaerales bacterium JB043]
MSILRTIGRRVVVTASALSMLAISTSTFAANGVKLTSDGNLTISQLGASVAIEGDTAIVGAPLSNSVGAALVYVRSGATWMLQETIDSPLPPTQITSGAQMGGSVAISGDTAVIGAPRAYSGNGTVFVYTRTGASWTLQAEIGTLAAGSNGFGISVAIENDTIVIGHPTFQQSVGPAGAAFVFTRTGSNWDLESALIAPDPKIFAEFGQSVSISSSEILVGAPKADREREIDGEIIPRTGAAYIFSPVGAGGDWEFTQKLTDDIGETDDRFGYSVSIDGFKAIIGAPETDQMGKTNAGSALAFEQPDPTLEWEVDFILRDNTGGSDDKFGTSVSISGDTAIVGAPGNDYGGASVGSAFVYERDVTTTNWNQLGPKITALDADSSAANFTTFGYSCAVSGDTFIIGMDNFPTGLTFGYAAERSFFDCFQDLSCDGMIDGTDMGILLGNWGAPGITDLDKDGTTDGADLGILIGAWGPCP